MNKFLKPAIVPTVALTLGGCSWIGVHPGPAYQESKTTQSLSVPPGMTAPKTSSTYAVPAAAVPAPRTAAPVTPRPASPGPVAATTAKALPPQAGVVPTAAGMHLVSHQGAHWLTIDAAPGVVWPQVMSYFKAKGFKLAKHDARTGIIRTEWKAVAAGLPKGLTSHLFRNLYDSGKRERYVVRLVSHLDGAATQVYLHYEGAVEENIGSGAMRWQWSKPNPGKEATALQSLMNYLADRLPRQAVPAAAPAPAVPPPVARGVATHPQAAPAPVSGQRSLTRTEPGDYTIMDVNEQPVMRSALPFATAWPQIGLALGREYFKVTRADRAKGRYYVTYEGQDHGNALSNLLGSGAVMSMGNQFIIVVKHRASGVQVEVNNPMMLPVETGGAQGILTLIRDGMVGPHRRAAASAAVATRQQAEATQAQTALQQARAQTGQSAVKYRLVSESHEPVLKTSAPMAVVWPQVGLALLHSQFIINAQDPAKGTYQVTYVGKSQNGGGTFINNLFDGGPVLLKGVHFRIYVQPVGTHEIWVHVQNPMGLPLPASGARAVLKVIASHLS